jgi:hypothetical protein
MSVEAYEIFNPDYFTRIDQIKESGRRFVYYTSAEAAMSIIRNEAVWLRNVQSMNDFSEVSHGYVCLRDALKEENGVRPLISYLDSLFPGFKEGFFKHVNGWYPCMKAQSYMICISEHDDDEDANGRLSMWRAYGGKYPVALVFKNGPLVNECDAFKANTNPVDYQGPEHIKTRLLTLENRIRENEAFVKSMGQAEVEAWVYYMTKNLILHTKHPGFAEEKEWRVVYNSIMDSSPYVQSEIVSLNGVPQQIYKIPLKNIPEENFNDATISEFVDRIIIGPTDEGSVLRDVFCKLLTEVGCEDANKRVYCSGIPLRAEN